MTEWPLYVFVAADAVGFSDDEPSGHAALQQFLARWSGWGPVSILHAFREGDESDRHFALHLLIAAGMPHAREDAAPQLLDDDSDIRWHAAIYLGVLGDAHAAVALARLLTEGLPSPSEYHAARAQQAHYESMRLSAAYLLGTLGDSHCIPMLREALSAVLGIEEAQPDAIDILETERWRYASTAAALRQYADTLVYSAGRLGGLGLLTGLPLIAERKSLWPLHLIMGSLHGHYPIADITRFADHPPLRIQITETLATMFGFMPTAIDESMALYERGYLFRVRTLYEAEADEIRRRWTPLN